MAGGRKLIRYPRAALGTAILLALSASAIAVASGIARPKLISPTHSTAPGRITLVVKDTAATRKYPVFVQIEHTRKLNKYGALKQCTDSSKGCDFVELKRVKKHHGDWSYTAPAYVFPGWWATTPGKYYWQAEHVDCSFKSCQDVSKIGSFTVK
jgi:hypothetical protein